MTKETIWIAFLNPHKNILHASRDIKEADRIGRSKLEEGETFYLREYVEVRDTDNVDVAELAKAFQACGEARSAIRAVMFPNDPYNET